MASAGVWIGTAADRVLITNKTDIVGSIGVVTQHIDRSERNRKMGIKVTEIFSGKFKRIASDHAPLSEDGREVIQAHLDYIYTIFVETVAEYRGVTVDDVLARMADGRQFIGQQAIDAGLVDDFATLTQLIGRLNTPSGASKFAAVESSPPTLREQWEGSKDLRAEFGEFERFEAYENRNERRQA